MYWRPVLTGQATKLLPNCGLPMSGCGRAETEALVERLDKASTRYKMNMLGGAEKVKPVTNRAIGIRREKYIRNCNIFKCSGATDADDGSKPKILS